MAVTAPDAASLAEQLWDSLNGENKVSLFVRYLPLDGGAAETVIRNRLG